MARQSLLEYFQGFDDHRNEVAYVYRRGYRTERWRYGEVAEMAAQMARELKVRGLNAGDRVLRHLDPSAKRFAGGRLQTLADSRKTVEHAASILLAAGIGPEAGQPDPVAGTHRRPELGRVRYVSWWLPSAMLGRDPASGWL